ncbi:MAG: ATP-binding protein, partial [Acidobacteriota bacterium]
GSATIIKTNDVSAGNLAATPSINQFTGDIVQWGILGNDTYIPSGATVFELPAAAYKVGTDDRGRLILIKSRIVTDKLLRLPDTAGDKVLNSIDIFWNSRDKFQQKGQLFKRGILLWGPPGSGKTVTVMLLINDLIERGGIVIVVQNPECTTQALEYVRRIEPERPLICVMEDLDEMIQRYSESSILTLLDGENQVDNVVHVATTNYPENLDARLVNRPSRFDEVIKIGMPSAEARTLYLRSRLSREEMPDERLDYWVRDTEGMSVAHLRELVVAVFCLGRNYSQTLERLKKMSRPPRSSDRATIGLTT